jgi:carboxypeptidase C (cathepsin A)
VDEPVGTGFSYAKSSEGYNNMSDTLAVAELYDFLRKVSQNYLTTILYVAFEIYIYSYINIQIVKASILIIINFLFYLIYDYLWCSGLRIIRDSSKIHCTSWEILFFDKYIMGDSYSGIIIPILVQQISDGIYTDQKKKISDGIYEHHLLDSCFNSIFPKKKKKKEQKNKILTSYIMMDSIHSSYSYLIISSFSFYS